MDRTEHIRVEEAARRETVTPAADTPETPWLPPNRAAYFEEISAREVYRRTQPGDPHFLVSRKRLDGNPGLEINAYSMTDHGQKRLRESQLRNAATPKVEPAQLHLLPQTELDRQIAALDLPEPQRSVAIKWFHIVDLFLNSDGRARGHHSKGEWLKILAEQNETSQRSIERHVAVWKKREKLEDLADGRPGPSATGPGSKAFAEWDALGLDISLRAFVKGLWDGTLDGRKLTKRQIASEVGGYLTEKQRGCGVSHVYPAPPSRPTISRFIDSLDALTHARRAGPDAVKAACGYLDRRYDDLASLGVVEVDETKINALGYLESRQYKVLRFWIVTLYDERSIYPLVWDLIGAPDTAKKLHGITRRDELRLFEREVREYGLPGCLHSDRGRFRGQFWGYERKSRDREFQAADGILEQLGVRRNKPREKNPRGTRLERFHRFLADQARNLPGWIGGNEQERAMTSGDAQAAEHMEYVAGRRKTTPLLSRTQLLEEVSKWMEVWRTHPSDGTDMQGLSPRAVFLQNTPGAGFRQPTAEEWAVIDSEVFSNRKILPGGVIELPDAKRYGLPGEITLEQGQWRDVVRQRSNPSEIRLVPRKKGEAKLVAHLRPRVGANEPDELARQMELQNRVRKIAGEPVKALEYDPGSQLEPPRAAQVIHPSEFIAAQEAAPPAPECEISSSEYLMEDESYKKRVKPLDFADLEG